MRALGQTCVLTVFLSSHTVDTSVSLAGRQQDEQAVAGGVSKSDFLAGSPEGELLRILVTPTH